METSEMILGFLQKRSRRILLPLSPSKHTARRYCLWTRKWVLTWHRVAGTLTLCFISRIVRNKLSLWFLLEEPKCTETSDEMRLWYQLILYISFASLNQKFEISICSWMECKGSLFLTLLSDPTRVLGRTKRTAANMKKSNISRLR